jgi:hypothetical protein
MNRFHTSFENEGARVGQIGNYYGVLRAKEVVDEANGEKFYFMGIGNWDGDAYWEMISESLYREMLAHNEQADAKGECN